MQRPVPGCSGVDYLAPGALTESLSYVFGPVLKLLKAEGFEEGKDLGAAPYDWRIPPNELERRDKYFTNTMKLVEQLYKKSGNRKVVLLCHSMGCKTGHYLLNFVLQQLGKNGQAWIDKHVHSYVPVGAPHLGAQKSIRGIIDGDKMGLEAFLDEDEGLMLGRSFGSVPWLFPIEAGEGDSSVANPPIPTVVVRNESSLRIILPAQQLSLKSFVHNRKKLPPTKVRLAIQIGNSVTVRTDFCEVRKVGHTYDSLQVDLKEGSWLIACPPTIEETLRMYPCVQLRLEEPGTGKPPADRKGLRDCDALWIFRLVFCIICWVFCCPCSVMWKLGCTLMKGTKKGVDKAAELMGDTRDIGISGQLDWTKGVIDKRIMAESNGGEEGAMMYNLWAKIATTDNVEYGLFLTKPVPEPCTISVKWEPSNVTPKGSNIVLHGHDAKKQQAYGIQKKCIEYNSVNSKSLIQMEGLTDAMNLVKDTYANDLLGPTTLSSYQPPPIKKVTAIYGINLDTEVSGVYKRSPSVRISMSSTHHSVQQKYVLDKEATLNKKGRGTHIIDDGVIYETKDTPQKIVGDDVSTVKKSGDGTVSYWSLQHVKSWQGACDVTVHEIDRAEHREILNDKRFHALLLQILGCR